MPPTPVADHTLSQHGNGTGANNPGSDGADVTLPCNVAQEEAGTHVAGLSPIPTSPIEWRPAEDVLPLELNHDEATAPVNRREVQPLLVYSRRRQQAQTEAADHNQHDAQAPQNSNTVVFTTADARAEFIEQISWPVTNILTPEAQPRRHRRLQQAATTQAPRCSRGIAKLPPEYQQKAASTVCRQLGFVDQQQQRHLSDGTMAKYTEFFTKPLSREHVRALAALLGKELPPAESIQVESPAIEVV